MGPWLPLLGLFTTREWYESLVLRASEGTQERICSMHVGRSYSDCGLHLSRKPAALITPNDIAYSSVVRYVGTLTGE